MKKPYATPKLLEFPVISPEYMTRAKHKRWWAEMEQDERLDQARFCRLLARRFET